MSGQEPSAYSSFPRFFAVFIYLCQNTCAAIRNDDAVLHDGEVEGGPCTYLGTSIDMYLRYWCLICTSSLVHWRVRANITSQKTTNNRQSMQENPRRRFHA